jgi:nucleotide-binding universal stress UspA family protein
MTSNPTAASDMMPTFDRLLVATDFSVASQAACRTAVDTAFALGASLYILHVFNAVSLPGSANSTTAPASTSKAVGEDIRSNRLDAPSLYERCRQSLDELQRQAVQAGVQCEAILGKGAPTAVILDTIAKKKIDLTIMGTSALHGLERIVFDSTTEAVLRQAPCPVLTVGPRARNPEQALQTLGPVVFATDFHFSTIHAIRFAACLSQLTESQLHCLHVMPRTLEACTERQAAPTIMSEALQELAAESGVVFEAPICATTYGSEVSTAVVDYARQQKAKLIVLGVRRASLEASQTHLHIAYRIITEAPCPVLTMAFASQPDAAIASSKRKATTSV